MSQVPVYQRLSGNMILTLATTATAPFEALFFNFHNTVLVSHLDVRHGFAQPLCTDHGLAYHPCCQPGHPCPTFETSFGYDPDDSSMLSCDQMPLKGVQL